MRRQLAAAALAAGLLAGCSTSSHGSSTGSTAIGARTDVSPATGRPEATPSAAPSTLPTPAPTLSATTVPPTTVEPTTTTTDPDLVRRVFPVQEAAAAGWSDTHHDYPATDVFHAGNCGTVLVAPVDGTVLELRREDLWSETSDDPSARGGISLSILGDDGVRYYMAHFRALEPALDTGTRVSAGQVVGEMGDTGRAGACHLHFALSPPCPTAEWWVRRGVVWPYRYLADWQRGVNTSPVDEVLQWAADHPEACSTPPADA